VRLLGGGGGARPSFEDSSFYRFCEVEGRKVSPGGVLAAIF
jgi:hypothetical protein